MSADSTESFWLIDTAFPYIGAARTLADYAREFEREVSDSLGAPTHRNTLAALSALNPQFVGPGRWGEPWPAFPPFVNLRWWRWHAGVPPTSDGAALPAPLRMRQRNDGLGSFDGNARLVSRLSANGPTSGQLSGARIGARNLYDSGGPGRQEGGGL